MLWVKSCQQMTGLEKVLVWCDLSCHIEERPQYFSARISLAVFREYLRVRSTAVALLVGFLALAK